MDLTDEANSMKSTSNRKVLIIEPCAYGHHGPYVRWMAAGLAERGFDVTLITLAETVTHPSMQEIEKISFGEGGGSLRLIGAVPHGALPSGEMGSVLSLVAREQAYWRLFRAWYKAYAGSARPDVVFLPYLDYCLYAIGVLGSPFGDCPWVGLAMRPSFHYRAMGIKAPRPALAGIKKALFFRVLRNRYLLRLLTIDESLAGYLGDTRKFSGKVAFFPEPAEFGELPAPDEAKRKLGITPERKLILLYGAVTARKGVIELLRALATPGFPSGIDVLVAGEVRESGIADLLSESWVRALQESGQLKFIDRFIEVAEEPVLFAAADIVWLGYRGHYNASGLLVQAASAGCPVLACKKGLLDWQTERHSLGRVVNPANSAEVAAAVDALLREQMRKQVNHGYADTWRPPSFSEAQDALAQALMAI